MLDIAVTLQQYPSNISNIKNVGDVLKKCKVCNKKIKLKDMRVHVGGHILRGTINGHQICGFCGTEGCVSSKEKSSKKGSQAFFKIQSNCSYYYDYKRVPDKPTCAHISTNKLVECPSQNCSVLIWKYNAPQHFQTFHPLLSLEENFVVSEQEKKGVLTHH